MKKISKILIATICAVLVLSTPIHSEAKMRSKDAAVEHVQDTLNMNKTGYLKCDLNLRALPTTKSAVIKAVKEGKKIQYRKYDGDWVMVVHGNRIGFLRSKYISDKKIVKDAQTKVKYSASYFRKMGVINWDGWRWTWYSEKVLPGGGLKIPGRHVDENGYIRDEDGYICLASGKLKKGTVVDTPFGGKGKVYDSGCSAGTLDCYVSW